MSTEREREQRASATREPPLSVRHPLTTSHMAVRDASGIVRGCVSQSASSSARLEVLEREAEACVIVTVPDKLRCLCFAGSRVELAGCVVDLEPAAGAPSIERAPTLPTTARPLPARRITMQAAIMAGGLATRFAPIAGPHTGLSKPAVPIGLGKSLIRNLVEQLIRTGIEDIFINTHHAEAQLRAGLEGARVRLHYLHESAPSGTAGPIRKALQGRAYPALDLNQPLLVLQGDALTDISLVDFLQAHGQMDNPALSIGVQAVPDQQVHEYGIVATDRARPDGVSGRIVGFLEKPTLAAAGPHRLASTGTYVLGPALFPVITAAYERKLQQARTAERRADGEAPPAQGEPLLDFAKDVFPLALEAASSPHSPSCSAGLMLHAHLTPGYWNDIGTPARYFKGLRDLRSGCFQQHGPLPLDSDPSGVVYWGDGRALAEQTLAMLRGNVIVVPSGWYDTASSNTERHTGQL